MKNWTKVFASAAFAAIGSIALAASAYGQEFPRIPTNCIIRADEVFVNDRPFVSVGTMNLSPGEDLPRDADNPFARMQLLTNGFSAQSNDPVLGTIKWELDNSRPPVTTSLLRSNQEDALFPATVQLDFNVRATFSSQPGRVFLSSTPISIANANIISWPPGEIDGLNSVDADGDGQPEPVDFIDAETRQFAFRVNRLISRVRD